MPLSFIQNDVKFEGFKPYTNPADMNFREHRLVVAWFEGEPELWITDGKESLERVKALYEAEWGPGRVVLQEYTMLP